MRPRAVHYIDPMSNDTATVCGLATTRYSSTPFLDAVTCKVCLKVVTQQGSR